MTSTTSYAGYFPYGKCKHVDCIQGDLERAHELGEWALSFGAVLEGDGLGEGDSSLSYPVCHFSWTPY